MRIPAKVLEDIWECSEWRVEEFVQRLDRLIFVMLDDARAHGVKRAEAIEYFATKLSETIDKVAENRETDKQQANRQKKQIAELTQSKLEYIYRPKPKEKKVKKDVANGI